MNTQYAFTMSACGLPSQPYVSPTVQTHRPRTPTGKTILITGASRGLGYATAKKFAGDGWRVFGTSTTEKGLDNLLQVIGAMGAVCDVHDPASIRNAVERMVQMYGKIDVLMNNIGTRCREPIDKLSVDDVNNIMHVNFTSAFYFTKECVPFMADRSRIVNINSLAGLQPYGNSSIYVASKYAMTGFAKSIRHELYGKTQVVNIYPGGIHTDFHDTPRPEFMDVQDVADIVHFATTRPWNAHIPEIVIAPERDTRLP
jgi:NADP-dependent 3-hydroxy acid dehydrogenase YdfG